MGSGAAAAHQMKDDSDLHGVMAVDEFRKQQIKLTRLDCTRSA